MSARTIPLPLSGPAPVMTGRGEHLTFKANQSLGRHGWLRLTPAYSLHLVQRLVAELPSHTVTLDPFCGTGTTALACASQGLACDTADINPFLVWFAAVKCAAYASADAAQAGGFAQALSWRDLLHGGWTPPLQDIHKWWPEPTLTALAALFAAIKRLPDAPAQQLLWVAFCRTAIQTAAVSFGHQSMSFRRSAAQPALFSEKPAETVVRHFQQATADIVASVADNPTGQVQVYQGDARQLAAFLPARRYAAVITSPPYPNRMSYIRELRPYMYWLGYLADGRQAGELDWQAIGGTWGCATSLTAKWLPNPAKPIPWPGFEARIAHIKAHSDVLGRYVHKYFEDAFTHIEALTAVLQPGAVAHYVVGNSKFYDVLVPTEAIYAALFEAVGFTQVRVEPIRKRTSKKELFEYIVHATWP